MGIVLWRMIRTFMRLLGGSGRRSAEDILRDHRPSSPPLDKIEDAEFEDITPPKTPEDNTPKPDQQ
jgi:hypothetical protein